MNFSFDNNLPIYVQLVDELKKYIVSGEIKPGEKLMSVRDLANVAKVNPNTMQKALVELENAGLLYTERTSGRYVTKDISKITEIKNAYAKKLAQDYIFNMQKIGISKDEALKYLKGDK